MKLSIASSLMIASVALAATGCTVIHKEPAPAAAPAAKPKKTVNPPPAPTAAPAEQTKGDGEGKPPSMKSGAPENYWVWHDGQGWHLRTTTAKNEHLFYGRVVSSTGEVKTVKAISQERNDEILLDQGQVKFEFSTHGAMDGFDFTVPDGACVSFHLFVDKQDAKGKITVGASEKQPPSNHFKICL